MTDEAMTGATPAPAVEPAVISRFADEQPELSHAEYFRQQRAERVAAQKDQEQQATPSIEDDVGAADQQNSGDEPASAVAGDDQQPSGNDTGTNDAGDDLPPIAPPRSWTKEEKAAFAALPREHQQTIAERERARHADVDRRLNEISRQEQAAKAREQAAEQARQDYEQRLPLVAQVLNSEVEAIQQRMAADFPDIRGWDDVEKLAVEDPLRHSQFKARLDRLNAAQARANAIVAEAEQAEQRRRNEAQQSRDRFLQEENKRFLELAPEYADPQKGQALRSETFNTLVRDYGFTAEEISGAWSSGFIPMHDHRVQLAFAALSRLTKAEKAAKTVRPTPQPAPQVQRPAPATTSKDARSEHVKTLEQRLTKTGSRQAYMALQRAKRG